MKSTARLKMSFRVSSKLLKQGGKLALVHRPGRLLEIFELMKAYQIEPKRVNLSIRKKGKKPIPF
jgi:tRNA1(Val) A37 N6-methylase TrmN6